MVNYFATYEDIFTRVVCLMGGEERAKTTSIPQQYECIVKTESERRSHNTERVGRESTPLAGVDCNVASQTANTC